MATTYNKLLLDINEKPNDIITAVQNDTNSRYLDVLLYDNGVPINLDGCEVKIFMNKPEKGGEIWDDGVITDAENGRCEFLLTTEALTHFGHLQVQISIWKDNTEILSTQIFEIIVTKSLLGASSVEASNEYGTLVILFQSLYEAYDLMTRMVENIGVPAEVAAQYDLATMWQAWEFLVAYMKGDLTQMISDALANASVQGVLDKIGDTADTGGSSTAGTVMAKENAIFDAVKNINSHINKQTLVANATFTTADTHTLLEVTGKGKLYACALKDTFSANNCNITIIADGEEIVNTTVENTGSTSGGSGVVVAPFGVLMLRYDSGLFMALDLTWNQSNTPTLVMCAAGKTNVSVSGRRLAYVVLEDFISFENSLKITVKNVYTSAIATCLYSLDE